MTATGISSSYTLREALVALWTSLPEALVQQDKLHLLQQSASLFPPLLRIGLECRMDERTQVDLQLCLRRDDDLATLCPAITGIFSDAAEPDERLSAFLLEWADPDSSFHREISEVFLEYDVLPSGTRLPLLFFALEKGMDPAATRDLAARVVETALGKRRTFLDPFEQLTEKLPEGAFVAYLGILFSRDINVLRVNIKGLRLSAVGPFLRAIGFAGDEASIRDGLELAYGLADRVTLCLDLGETIFPRIGLECFWDQSPEKETYWRYFLEAMEQRGICRNEKAGAVLQWNEDIVPGTTSAWPEHLWMESLKRPESSFTLLRKKVSHLKLSCGAGRPAELKAYLGYGNIWRSFGKDEPLPPPPQEEGGLAEAIGKGTDFLLKRQLLSGWWKDFSLPAGSSDEWVTAFMGWHLLEIPDPGVRDAAEKAREILATRYRPGKGWGYNALTPADADSTVWTHLFFTRLGEGIPDYDPLLHSYLGEDGGAATYVERQPIQAYTQLADSSPMDGWQQAHACVTAAYALTGNLQSLSWLAAHQTEAGYWAGYWWFSDTYATALATEAMCVYAPEQYRLQITMAKQWTADLLRSNLSSLSAFALALAVRTLLAGEMSSSDKKLITSGIERLLHLQEQDGGWPISAELRVPMPGVIDPLDDSHYWRTADVQRNFGTATVLHTLALGIKKEEQL